MPAAKPPVPAPDNAEPKSIREQILAALNSVTTLTIRTVVHGSVDKEMRTDIQLVTGDIKTEMAEDFVTGQYAALRDFHMKREEEAQEIVKRNVDAVMQLLSLEDRAKNPAPAPSP